MFEDDQDPAVVDTSTDQGGDNSGSGSGDGSDVGGSTPAVGADNKPFLVVNDRTQFKSEADAIRAYHEAGQRISQLTPWQRAAAEAGIKDPKEMATLLKDALDRKAAEATRKGDNDTLAKLPEAERKAVEWLQANLERGGAVTKKEFSDFMKEIKDTLSGFQKTVEPLTSAQETAAIEDGQNLLRGALKDSKYPVSDAFANGAEVMVRSWIEAEPERLQRFFASSADRRALIAEGIAQAVKPFADAFGAASIAKAGNQGAAVKQVNRTPVSRPDVRSKQAPPVPRSQANPGNKNSDGKKSNREMQNDLDDKAWALFNEVLQEQGAPE